MKKKLESLSSTFQRWRRKVFVARSTQEKKKSLLNHLHRNYFLCSSSSQAFSLCRSSLSHYHWFKVLWEKAEYLYVFLMFGQQWTIAQLRDGGLSSHISTLAPTNQLNVLIFVLKVKCWYFLWASCLFRRQKKHSAALLFFAYSDYFITPRLWTNGQKNWEATYQERRTLFSGCCSHISGT